MKNYKTIIDVRTPSEFKEANAEGSINIPLSELEQRVEEIKTLQQPIVVCCATGIRSAKATTYLKKTGIDCANGGSWIDVR